MLTKSTCFPVSANATLVAHASEVLPTPPLPVKKTILGRAARYSCVFTLKLVAVSGCALNYR